MAGSSLHEADVSDVRWKLFPLPQFTSRLFGVDDALQCNVMPCVTRTFAVVNTLPPPVMKPVDPAGVTVTVNVWVVVMPDEFVAVHVTVVVPTGNVEPDGG